MVRELAKEQYLLSTDCQTSFHLCLCPFSGESPSYMLTSGRHKRLLYWKKHSSKSPKTWVLFWTKIGGGHLPLMSMSSYPCEWTRGHGLDHPALTVKWGVHRQLDQFLSLRSPATGLLELSTEQCGFACEKQCFLWDNPPPTTEG